MYPIHNIARQLHFGIIKGIGESMQQTRALAIRIAKNSGRGCFVTGHRVMHGHKVSHSKIKTNRVFKSNISYKNKFVDENIGTRRIRLSRRGERTILKYGGLKNFVLNCKRRKLTLSALQLRNELLAVSE